MVSWASGQDVRFFQHTHTSPAEQRLLYNLPGNPVLLQWGAGEDLRTREFQGPAHGELGHMGCVPRALRALMVSLRPNLVSNSALTLPPPQCFPQQRRCAEPASAVDVPSGQPPSLVLSAWRLELRDEQRSLSSLSLDSRTSSCHS